MSRYREIIKTPHLVGYPIDRAELVADSSPLKHGLDYYQLIRLNLGNLVLITTKALSITIINHITKTEI